ncbi:MAG: hypothetical protein ACLUD1_13265 [Clostridia bacterium]
MEYCVRYINLPVSIRGITVLNNGFYNIYINAKLSYEDHQRAIHHQLTHVKRNDFYYESAIEEIEDM